MAQISGVPAQCGMTFLSSLDSNAKLEDQIYWLERALNGFTQTILTDATVNESTRWAELKSCCYQGPSTTNPNSKRSVKVYIATKESLKELKALEKEQAKQKQ